MLTRCCLAVLLLVASASADGFSYPLFDGKTLEGWTTLDGKPVTRVRYAWGDSAITNLTDDAGLPVGAFEISVS